jgi:hypothetical protein
VNFLAVESLREIVYFFAPVDLPHLILTPFAVLLTVTFGALTEVVFAEAEVTAIEDKSIIPARAEHMTFDNFFIENLLKFNLF